MRRQRSCCADKNGSVAAAVAMTRQQQGRQRGCCGGNVDADDGASALGGGQRCLGIKARPFLASMALQTTVSWQHQPSLAPVTTRVTVAGWTTVPWHQRPSLVCERNGGGAGADNGAASMAVPRGRINESCGGGVDNIPSACPLHVTMMAVVVGRTTAPWD